MQARFDGVLPGEANPDGTACLWVGDGERMALVWPSGYIARGNPLAVYDQHGALIGESENTSRWAEAAERPTTGTGIRLRLFRVHEYLGSGTQLGCLAEVESPPSFRKPAI